MRRQFKDTILDLARSDETIVLLFGDVSVYLFKEFQERYPDRFYNIGICENTLISAAAGLSSQGFTPFVHTIAPFLTERCLEQIKLDLCYNRFPANIVTCGATFDYAWDGATHHCHNDLAILRLLPGMGNDKMDERKFDGRAKFTADESIEDLLVQHFERFNVSAVEICNNFFPFTRGVRSSSASWPTTNSSAWWSISQAISWNWASIGAQASWRRRDI